MLQTAVSDDERFHETVKGNFWDFRYPAVDRSRRAEFVTVATTRPETMLGDTAVAVHPEPSAALDKAERGAESAAGSRVYEGQAGNPEAIDDLRDRRCTTLRCWKHSPAWPATAARCGCRC